MIIDFDGSDVLSDSLRRPVVVVGAGPVGLALARGLRERGIGALVVESGGATSTASSPFNLQESTGLPFTGAERRGRGLGGSSGQWAAQCMRFHHDDFARRAWVAESGWPFSYDELLPFYGQAEQFLDVSADDYHARSWLLSGLQPGSMIDLDVPVRFSVYAPVSDLMSRDRRELTADRSTVLLYNATVTGLLRRDDRITGVEIRSLAGRSAVIEAETVVIATGAIETARLMLHPSDHFAQGVGNAQGHVGRHFQDHPTGPVADILPTGAADRFAEVPEWFAIRRRGGRRHLPRLVLSPETQRSQEVLNACALVGFEWADDSMTEHLRQLQSAFAGRRFDLSKRASFGRVLRRPVVFGRTAIARARGRSFAEEPSRVRLHVHLEQAPTTVSRVVLGDRRDPLGRRVASIDWRLGDDERRTALTMVEQAAGYFARHRLGQVRPDPALLDGSWTGLLHDNQHHAGTARMSASASGGVVDLDGRVFGMRGLYVAGGATFPTSSYANPTLTMVATAFRLAAVIDRARRRPSDPAPEGSGGRVQPSAADHRPVVGGGRGAVLEAQPAGPVDPQVVVSEP